MTKNRWQAWPEKRIVTSSHCPRRWEQPCSSSNPQSDITSDKHFKILLRILSNYSKITSLLHLREYALYEFVETNTFSIHTPEGRRNCRRSNLIVQQAWFIPHLPRSFILDHYWLGWIGGEPVHHFRSVVLQRVARRSTLDGRGRVVSSYSWRNKKLSLGRWRDMDKRIGGCI